MPNIETEARRKEREQNTVSRGPRWLWDWRLWVAAAAWGIGVYVLTHLNGNHFGY